MEEKELHITYCGPLAVTCRCGQNLTPKGMKIRGLIALLGEDIGQRRTRRWIESKLWSDRGPDQARGSLRQALADIRRTFGEHKAVLCSDRSDVWFDPELISNDLGPGLQERLAGKELLEGLDAKDPEFEEWLHQFRQEKTNPEILQPILNSPVTLSGISMRCRGLVNELGADRVAAQAIADQIGRNLEDTIYDCYITTLKGSGDIEVNVDIGREGNNRILHARIEHSDSGRVLYSDYRMADQTMHGLLTDEMVSEFCHDASVRTLTKLPYVVGLDKPEMLAAGFGTLAQKKLFEFRPEGMIEAETLIDRAKDVKRDGSMLAWHAFIKMTQTVERVVEATPGTLEETQALILESETLAPENSQVHALNALTHVMLFDDIDRGLDSAQRSLDCNPRNHMARQSMAVVAAAAGDLETAYTLTSNGSSNGQVRSPHHLWDLYRSLVCVSTQRFDEARMVAERALRSCPDFRAPRRLLVGLYASEGQGTAASKHFRALCRREPWLTTDQFLNDEEYPTRTLRNAGKLGFSSELLTM